MIFKTGIQNVGYFSKLTRFPLLYLLDIQQYVTQTFNNMEKANKSQTRRYKCIGVSPPLLLLIIQIF